MSSMKSESFEKNYHDKLNNIFKDKEETEFDFQKFQQLKSEDDDRNDTFFFKRDKHVSGEIKSIYK